MNEKSAEQIAYEEALLKYKETGLLEDLITADRAFENWNSVNYEYWKYEPTTPRR